MIEPFVGDLKEAAKSNENFREVMVTGEHSQVVLMTLREGEEIGEEVHRVDQFFYFVDGEGKAVLDGVEHEVEKGFAVFVPAGLRHNIVAAEDEELKLFTLYAPPQHAPGTIVHHKETASVA